MNFFRNPEIRRSLWLWLALGAALALGGGLLLGPWAGLWTGAAWLAAAALHYGLTRRRYRALAELSRALDRILHSDGRWELAAQEEGELSVLRSEIAKMTVRLREQADALLRDRNYLADALADLSHQLRTPLTSLRLAVSLLSGDELTPEERRARTRELHRLLDRMDWLLEALLKQSRLDAGAVRFTAAELPVRALLRRAAAPVAVPMDLRDQTLEIAAGDETVWCDPEWTAEAVTNVLKNCMEHTPPGGTVRVAARQTAVFTELTVSDTGPGIAPEDLPHVFERFYRGRGAAAESAGVGLALARAILTAQGDTIRAGSGRQGGAEFVLRFYRGAV